MQIPYAAAINGAQTTLGPFPFAARGVTVVNATNRDATVTDDRGISNVVKAGTIVSYPPNPTHFLVCQLASAATAPASLTVYVSNEAVPITSSGLAIPAGGSSLQRVSVIPAAPNDGDVIVWEPDTANFPGRLWTAIYNSTRARWEIIGASTLGLTDGSLASYQNTVASTWQRIYNTITVPRTGLYRCRWSNWIETTNTGDDFRTIVADGAGTITSNSARRLVANDPGQPDYTAPGATKELTLTQGNLFGVWMGTFSAGLANGLVALPSFEIEPIYFT